MPEPISTRCPDEVGALADATSTAAARCSRIASRTGGRDGHGDLLADDIFCLDDGPRVLDCLEFDDRLRYGDVLADVAFLAMDLERLGRTELARPFLDWYREFSAETYPESLAHHYIAYRAHVRSKIACLRGSPEDQNEARGVHLSQCLRHLRAGQVAAGRHRRSARHRERAALATGSRERARLASAPIRRAAQAARTTCRKSHVGRRSRLPEGAVHVLLTPKRRTKDPWLGRGGTDVAPRAELVVVDALFARVAVARCPRPAPWQIRPRVDLVELPRLRSPSQARTSSLTGSWSGPRVDGMPSDADAGVARQGDRYETFEPFGPLRLRSTPGLRER